ENNEQDALRKFLPVNSEITQVDQGTNAQNHPQHGADLPRLGRKHQQGQQPQQAEDETLAQGQKSGCASKKQQEMGNCGEIPEKKKCPAQAAPIDQVHDVVPN